MVAATSSSRGTFAVGLTAGAIGSLLLVQLRSRLRKWRRRKVDRCPGPVYLTLCKRLHGTASGPFAEVDDLPDPDHKSYPHTHLPLEFLQTVIPLLKPSFLVEVGSMMGGSARRIAQAVVASTPVSESLPCLLCIDTFLGDTAMWMEKNPGWRDWLKLEHGFPRLYWQFLANVEQWKDVILPLPLTSMCALRALQLLALERAIPLPDFIYLDSAHAKGETLLELNQAWRLLAVGGVLVGDDLDWPAVESDLRAFVAGNSSVAGSEDTLLGNLPGVVYQSEGYWVLDSVPRQWVLRKKAGGLEELRRLVDEDVNGAEPVDYVPLTEQDRQAHRIYEEGVELTESGCMREGEKKMKQAASMSDSLKFHYQL